MLFTDEAYQPVKIEVWASEMLDNGPVICNGIGRRYVSFVLVATMDTIGRNLFCLNLAEKEYTLDSLLKHDELKRE